MKIQFYFPILLLISILACKNESTSPPISGAAMTGMQNSIDLDRFEKEILAFEKQDSINGIPKDEILFVGSSSIRMWKSLTEDMSPYPVLNRGFGGSTIPEVLAYGERIVYKYNPRLIFFYCGENDINDGTSPLKVFRNFKEFAGDVNERLPNTKIVFISMKPSMRRWSKFEKTEKGNQMIKSFCSSIPNLDYVDVGEVMLTETGIPDTSIFIQDSLHMNAAGYERWTTLIRPLVEKHYTLQ